MRPRIRFDRNELAGAFGDIGTDLPLIVLMLAAWDAPPALVASVFIMFGLMQMASGLIYGLPMPVQPLKAMAAIVIAGGVGPETLFGGGLAVGLIMLALTASKVLGWLARVIPLCVVRGVQLGLGLKLAWIGLADQIPSDPPWSYAVAALGAMLVLALWGNRRLPAALLLIGLGAAYALLVELDLQAISSGVGLALPTPHVPALRDVWTGLLVLALPQIPLSLSNSVIATARTTEDLFPARAVSVQRIGFSYSMLNLLGPFLSAIPVCHGCGGLAGHYAFGGRTGGSPLIYGVVYLVLGLAFSAVFSQAVGVFPKPILGVLLVFEGLALMRMTRGVASDPRGFTIALLVGATALGLPKQGFLVATLVGVALYYLWRPAGIDDGSGSLDPPAGHS